MRTMLLASLLTACISAGRAADLVIISPHWEGIRKECGDAFEQWHLERFGEPVKVEWLDQGGTSDDVKFIESEFAGGKSGIGIDVFWGGGVDPHVSLAEKGLLQPYRVSEDTLSAIPPDYFGSPMYDPEYRWYGTALSGFGIIVNDAVMERMGFAPIERWEDLGRPELASWVGSADPRSSGSVHMMYEIILQAYGWERGFDVLHRMGANIRSFPDSSSQTSKDVALGEVAAGISIDIYALAQIAEAGSDKLQYVVPEGQTLVNPDGIAILKGAPNLVCAQRMVEFALSKEGQELLLLPRGVPGGPKQYALGRMSMRPDVFEAVGDRAVVKTNPFALKSSLRYNSKLGSSRWALVNDLIGTLIIDCHDDLTTAWDAVRRAGMPEDAAARLVEMPITEQEALDLAANVWSRPDEKNIEIERWTEFARDKYAAVVMQTSGPSTWRRFVHGLRYVLPGLLAIVVAGLLLADAGRRVGVIAHR